VEGALGERRGKAPGPLDAASAAMDLPLKPAQSRPSLNDNAPVTC
jgi:hypothetical protein